MAKLQGKHTKRKLSMKKKNHEKDKNKGIKYNRILHKCVQYTIIHI